MIKIVMFLVHAALLSLVVTASVAAFVNDTTLNNWVVVLSIGAVSAVVYLTIVYGFIVLYGKWGGDGQQL